jgi:thymidylate synthase (FAD)
MQTIILKWIISKGEKMEIIEPSVKLETPVNYTEDARRIYCNLERYGRVAYKSESLIDADSAEIFIRKIIKNGHESVLEHESFTVRFICDRGVSHELVRHRLCAFTQESTRYCNYYKKGIQFIKPCFLVPGSKQWFLWEKAMVYAEKAYNEMIQIGMTPQEARSVLPNSLKTEIVVTANMREWRHILKLRTSPAAHPQMQQVMNILKMELQARLPVIFGDL